MKRPLVCSVPVVSWAQGIYRGKGRLCCPREPEWPRAVVGMVGGAWSGDGCGAPRKKTEGWLRTAGTRDLHELCGFCRDRFFCRYPGQNMWNWTPSTGRLLITRSGSVRGCHRSQGAVKRSWGRWTRLAWQWPKLRWVLLALNKRSSPYILPGVIYFYHIFTLCNS